MSTTVSALDQMIHKLSGRSALTGEDKEAILSLPHTIRSYHAATYVVREGEPPPNHCSFIRSGFAVRQKITAQGARQIMSLHLVGDFIDLEHLFLNIADHNVQALTELEVVAIDRRALESLVLARPNIARALWIDALVDASIYREWVTNVGRRAAPARIAHVLCEVALRMQAAGVSTNGGFELPLTQEQLADAVGLTPVHVNRTLKALVADGILHRDKRYISFTDWNRTKEVADFNALYLHLEQAKPA
ncbi:Crp/Fnr family transcriptional regulator [Croceibacterium soli]|uniref:Crp/Fnr family transcriptional regulator n=1 Tax=Croceibacterium soli TaxID=1739690 RepID=UPI002E25BC39